MASHSNNLRRPLTQTELEQLADNFLTNSDDDEWSGDEGAENNEYIVSDHDSESELSGEESDTSEEHSESNSASDGFFFGREKTNKTKW